MNNFLVAYASAGNGHRTAAKALKESLASVGEPVMLADVLDFSDPVFRRVYSDMYNVVGERSHGVCKAMYRITDRNREESGLVKIIDRVSDKRVHAFSRFVLENNPECVVATHFLPMTSVARLKSKGLYDGLLFSVITDYDLHQMWFSPQVDGYFTATDEIAAKLEKLGVGADRIVASGIPVRRRFLAAAQVKVTRPKLSVLFLASSIADEKALHIIDQLTALGDRVELTVICGRNEDLLKKLQLDGGPEKGLNVYGFVDDIERFFTEADILITKPGGLTVAEALCCALPMILVYPIPFQETRNADFLQKRGAGVYLEEVSRMGALVGKMM